MNKNYLKGHQPNQIGSTINQIGQTLLFPIAFIKDVRLLEMNYNTRLANETNE